MYNIGLTPSALSADIESNIPPRLMDDPDIQRLYDLVANDHDDEALALVRGLRVQGRSFPELDLYEGLTIYSRKDDLESLRLLVKFALENPSRRKRAYALFTCAICLINLGLERYALGILEGLPETYPDRDKEIQHCREHLNRQESALELMNGLLKK